MKYFCIILLLITSTISFTQSDELGVFLGASYYTGDLNPKQHFNQNTNPAAGLIYRRTSRGFRYAYRLHAMYGKIEGYDHQSNSDFLVNRNLNFSSEIFEVGAIWEVNFKKYELGNVKRRYISPFLFLGVSYFHFNPKAYYQNEWLELQPLGTEGQNTTVNSSDYYSLNQFAIPFGIGLKMNVSKRLGLAFEYGVRKTFTDYLDDVSKKYVDPGVLAEESGSLTVDLADRSYNQIGDRNIGVNRGVSELSDWYFFAGVSATFILYRPDECKAMRY